VEWDAKLAVGRGNQSSAKPRSFDRVQYGLPVQLIEMDMEWEVDIQDGRIE
jgi:hypothetical protein